MSETDKNKHWLIDWGIDIKKLMLDSTEGTEFEQIPIDERKRMIDELFDDNKNES